MTPLLVFDQFEEVFTLGRGSPEATEALLNELADLIEGRPPAAVKARLDADPAEARSFAFNRHPYKVLLSLREDFLPDLEGLRERIRAIVHNRLRLRGMDGEDALRVVLLAGGRLIEPDVAEQVIRFIAGEESRRERVPLAELTVEPALLSVVCRELNNRRRARGEPRITADLLQGNRTEILNDFYARSVADLDPAVRTFIEDRLLTGKGYRDRVALDDALEVPGLTRDAIDRLVERRLLRIEDQGGVQRVELTHDVLTGVVRASRDSRRQRESQERAEAAAREAAERERTVRRDLRRSFLVAALCAILALGAVAMAGVAWVAKQEAEEAAKKEKKAAKKVKDAKDLATAREKEANVARDQERMANANLQRSLTREEQAKRQAEQSELSARQALAGEQQANRETRAARGRLDLRTAASLADAGHTAQALAYLARALRSDPDNLAARGATFDLLLRRGWPLPLTMARYSRDGEPVNDIRISEDRTRAVTRSSGTVLLWDARTGELLRALTQDDDKASSFQLSPAGERVLATLAKKPDESNNPVHLWNARTGEPIGQPLAHEKPISVASFSPDGERVATGSLDKTARLWDAQTGKPLGDPLRHESGVISASFSPDGQSVVTTSSDKTARLWDATTGEPLGESLRHESPVLSASFSRDGTRVVTTSSDHTVRLWDARTGQPLGEPLRHEAWVDSAAFSPDGTRVVTASADETVRLWDARTGQRLGEPLRHEGDVDSTSFSQDGALLVTVLADKTARLWDARTGHALGEPMVHDEPLVRAWFSPDGRGVMTATRDGTVRTWTMRTAQAQGQILRHEDEVLSARFSPDGREIVTTAGDQLARIWNAHTGEVRDEALRLPSVAFGAWFSSDGERVVSDRLAWNARTGKPLGEPPPLTRALLQPLLSPDGRLLATVRGSSVDISDREGRTAERNLLHGGSIREFDFSRDSQYLVTISGGTTVRVWDARTGRGLGAPMRHEQTVLFASFSPDDQRVLTVSQDKAWVWEARTGRRIAGPLQPERKIMSSAQLDEHGRHLLVVSDDTARLWDVETGEPLGEPMRHEETISWAELSPDGRRVVTASGATCQVWDAETGQPLGEPMRHGGPVKSASFSPDGQRIVTASADKTARVWDVPTGSLEDAAELASLAEAVGGFTVRDRGSLATVPDPIARRTELARQARTTSFSPFLRWFLADPWERTIAPLSKVTVRQYLQEILANGTDEARREAARAFPGHPLLPDPEEEPR